MVLNMPSHNNCATHLKCTHFVRAHSNLAKLTEHDKNHQKDILLYAMLNLNDLFHPQHHVSRENELLCCLV